MRVNAGHAILWVRGMRIERWPQPIENLSDRTFTHNQDFRVCRSFVHPQPGTSANVGIVVIFQVFQPIRECRPRPLCDVLRLFILRWRAFSLAGTNLH
jgi:hypothetical protein